MSPVSTANPLVVKSADRVNYKLSSGGNGGKKDHYINLLMYESSLKMSNFAIKVKSKFWTLFFKENVFAVSSILELQL